MSKVSITRSLLDDLAMSISAKSGEPVPLTLTEMKDAVDGISGGGTTIDPLSVTSNGTYTAQSGHAYSPVTVNVPTSTPTLQSKTKSYTPTESAQTETVSADSGYDGLSSVSVSVGAISSTYVGSGITRRSSTDLTASGATVTVPSGYYSAQASKAVASGTAGTPTATKGTVSNHQVSVTPSVTNTTGYITGSTKTGTAVTVTASELASGNKAITQNGTGIDVVGYSTVSVTVPTGVDLTTFISSGGTTLTCNKTWAECFDLVDSGDQSALLTEGESYKTPLVASGYDSTSIYYTLYDIDGTPYMDFVYHSNGTITTTTPSHAATVLTTKTITANGTYNASSDSADGYSSVTVNVSGGGGSSMNMQVAQATTRASSSTYTSCVSLTCSVAGTYDVYWSCFRSSTSGTSGSQLHIGNSAYGTANTAFTNHIQNNHLTGVELAKNDTVAVYARSRGSNYYAYVGTLVIKQTA